MCDRVRRGWHVATLLHSGSIGAVVVVIEDDRAVLERALVLVDTRVLLVHLQFAVVRLSLVAHLKALILDRGNGIILGLRCHRYRLVVAMLCTCIFLDLNV